MSVSVGRNSRLRFAKLLRIDGIEFFDLMELPTIPEQPGDVKYRVEGSDRIDSLAHRFYGDPTLWWVLAVANDMELVPTTLSVGMEIRVPSPAWVNEQLFAKAQVK